MNRVKSSTRSSTSETWQEYIERVTSTVSDVRRERFKHPKDMELPENWQQYVKRVAAEEEKAELESKAEATRFAKSKPSSVYSTSLAWMGALAGGTKPSKF